jgi:hypothetical protein
MSTPPGEPPQPDFGQQPVYGQQPGYGQQPAQPIPNHLVWSILTTIFCCLPFGIVSIVHAAQVDAKRAGGDIQGALDASRKARTWAIAAAVAGPVLVFGWIFVVIVLGMAVDLGTGF